jgi:hypothetical protein
MAKKWENINHRQGTHVPLTRELHYEERHIPYACTIQFPRP